MAEEFARFLGWSDEQAVELRNHALLHDVGKIAIEQLMLYSPTRLRTLELHYQDHPTMGAIYLSINESLWQYIPTARNHHERWDGKDIRQGFQVKEIPLISRIIMVADSWDAMRSDRPYRKGLSKEKAMEEILKHSGAQFDPNIAKVFIKMLTDGEIQ